MTKLKTKKYWGLDLVDSSSEQWYAWLGWWLRKKDAQLKIVMTPNPEQMVLAERNQQFYEYLNQADVLLPDGNGLVWAAKVQERLTGADSVVEILRLVEREGLKVLLIGGRYEESGEHKLKIINEQLETDIYYMQGYKNAAQATQNETKAVQRLISDLRPEVVMVALGAPQQEKWLIENRELLRRNRVKLAMAVGGSFDFLLGKLKRAPQMWQKWRLEWLWRLIQEPSRLGRQLALPRFIWLVLRKKRSEG